MSLPPSLTVLLRGEEVGQVIRTGSRLSFVYADAWRGSDSPLSLSMPLSARTHGHTTITNWMWNLLPDNQATLREIASRHDVSANNPFALLWKIGLDCQGAVQFVAPDDLASASQPGSIDWLTDADIATRIVSLRTGSTQGRTASEGQFSLSGAQPKTALCFLDGRWGIPTGRLATTHILKPPSTSHTGHVQNEHFCLNLARSARLPAARSTIMSFGDEVAIVVERYDRITRDDAILRVHQEDLCQAIGLNPEQKYETDGGPGIRSIMKLLARSSAPGQDRRSFIQAIAFNFLILGTDAHAKNYSLLMGPGQVRLAPLYDVASFHPYAAIASARLDEVRMPMRIGDRRRYAEIEPRHIEQLMHEIGFPATDAMAIFQAMAKDLPIRATELRDDIRGGPCDHPVLDELLVGLTGWCRRISGRWWGE